MPAGFRVHIGHGIDYECRSDFICCSQSREADIGHAIIAAAVFSGLDTAVRRMKELLNNTRYVPNN